MPAGRAVMTTAEARRPCASKFLPLKPPFLVQLSPTLYSTQLAGRGVLGDIGLYDQRCVN